VIFLNFDTKRVGAAYQSEMCTSDVWFAS